MDRDQAFWDAQAKRYDRTMLVLGGPMPRAVERTAKAVEGRVLELAAGTGLFTRARGHAHGAATRRHVDRPDVRAR